LPYLSFSYVEIVQNKQPVVVVKPKNSEQNCNETRDHIKSLFHPVVDNINGLKSVGKSGVVIICKDSDSTRKLMKILSCLQKTSIQYESENLKYRLLIKFWPHKQLGYLLT
jgi:hypothetical protein